MDAKLSIVVDDTPIDANYFRTSDIMPRLDGDRLIVQCWRLRRNARVTVSCSSKVKQLCDTVVMVEVTAWHKWTIKPEGGNYYFVYDGDKWQRRIASCKAVKSALQTV